jgi:hypothetical protein
MSNLFHISRPGYWEYRSKSHTFIYHPGGMASGTRSPNGEMIKITFPTFVAIQDGIPKIVNVESEDLLAEVPNEQRY